MDARLQRLRRLAATGDGAAMLQLARDYERSGKRPMIVPAEFMVNADKPKGGDRWGWGAGGQLTALRFYLSPKVEILAEQMDGDYQGSCYALMSFPHPTEPIPVYVIWRDYFGSCGGCDGLEGNDGHEYIQATLAEGNTRQFWSLRAVIDYLNTTEDWSWTTDSSWHSGLREFRAELNKLAGVTVEATKGEAS